MADIQQLVPIIHKWEGPLNKFTNDPDDLGGATEGGVTFTTFKQIAESEHGQFDNTHDGNITVDDLKLMTETEFVEVLRKCAWDKWQGDKIPNQSVANILVDWVWGSGVYGITHPQRILGIQDTGYVGDQTIAGLAAAIESDAAGLFQKIWNDRKLFLDNIVKNNPAQQKFYQGWLNRLNDFKFTA